MTNAKQFPTYEVYAVRYATIERRAKDTFLTWREEDRPQDLDFFIWVIRGNSKTYVVDTGFSRISSDKRGRPFINHPTIALEHLGITASEVTDVIMTHLHYDHAGNTDQFPNAIFHLQEAEIAFATGKSMAYPMFREHYALDDVLRMVSYAHAGRVKFYDGDGIIDEGITVHRMDGHTIGLQSVAVNTERGTVVIASDALHYFANLEHQNPFPVVINVAAELEGYQRLQNLASSKDHLVPSHDPEVLARYPHAKGSVDIACLHLPPNTK